MVFASKNLNATALYSSLGLTAEEFESIESLLGRQPTHAELAMFSVMWSEHCSYKSSRQHLANLPTEADCVIAGPGENAGVVETPCGHYIAFKIESHNHPSAVEPFQGAATGIGGIVRDILSLGARPIALLDSLRFGPLDLERNRFLFDGVVRGIASYGNSLGLAVVGGEAVFDPCYNDNPLVNVVCIGIVEDREILRSAATAAGQAALLYGSPTGRDGIGGASVLASNEFTDDDQSKRPSVQVGDPFTEKLLIEATLEMKSAGLIAGVQDLGAAGITCAVSETAAAGGLGISASLDDVFLREASMQPWEVCMSESQERMLAAIEPRHVDEAMKICAKWGLQSAVIGSYEQGNRVVVTAGGDIVVDAPADALADGPSYTRQVTHADRSELHSFDPLSLVWPSCNDVLLRLLACPSIASKAWVWRQYDHMVRLNGVQLPPSDAAVMCIPERTYDAGGIAISVDGPARRTMLDPYGGGALAVAEAARNVACSGARPLAVTNCLNFGSPENPEVMGDFVEVVRGISEACIALGIPVTGGNVSFYNQSDSVAIYPTPVVAVLGYLEEIAKVRPLAPKPGDALVMIGGPTGGLGGSEALATCFGLAVGRPPRVDVLEEGSLCRVLVDLDLLATSAHDISDGGVAVCLAEMCIAARVGAEVRLPTSKLSPIDLLFSEGGPGAIVGCAPESVDEVIDSAARGGVLGTHIGTVKGTELKIDSALKVAISELEAAWSGSIPSIMES